MTATRELDRLLQKAGTVAYRKIGRVRLAHDPRLPGPTLAAAVAAVRAFAPAHPDRWPEYTPADAPAWLARGITAARDVCDDPCPGGIDPALCPAEWLVARCARYHFRLTPAGPGKVIGVGLDGWDMAEVRKHLPGWFAAACRERLAELVAAVAAGGGA